jgi:cysteine desulfurase
MESVYLDYAASNPIDPRVREAVLFAVEATGNPSSVHAHGRILREAIDSARESVAELLGVGSSCVHFTSGATEANNLAIRGYFRQLRESVSGDRPMKLLISAIEHPSVREVAKRMQTDFGVEVKSIPVDKDGVIRIDELKAELDEHVAMVCVMWANNVVGSL